MAFESCFGAFSKGLIHPVTGRGLLRAEKTHALHFKLGADESVEIDALGDEVAAKDGGWHAHGAELFAEALILLVFKEGHLPFEVLLPAEIAITAQPLAGHAFSLRHFDHGRGAGWQAVMTDVDVLRRKEDVQDLHAGLGCWLQGVPNPYVYDRN